jgi:hypothetical protein
MASTSIQPPPDPYACPVCADPMAEARHGLPCGHRLCISCVYSILNPVWHHADGISDAQPELETKAHPPCPLCRRTIVFEEWRHSLEAPDQMHERVWREVMEYMLEQHRRKIYSDFEKTIELQSSKLKSFLKTMPPKRNSTKRRRLPASFIVSDEEDTASS